MNKEQTSFYKKETVLLVACVSLVTGFLGGIVFSVYKSPAVITQTGQPAGQTADPGGKQADRILALEREVAANPKNAAAWTKLGNLYFDTKKYPAAINAYTKSLKLAPDDPHVLTDLGIMYRRNGQPDKALESFTRAAELDPRHQESRFNKGIVLLYDLNDRQGAIAAWQDLLRINPAATAPDGRPLREIISELNNSGR